MHGVEVEIKVVKRKGEPLNDDESTNPGDISTTTTTMSHATTSTNDSICPYQQQKSNDSHKTNGKLLSNLTECENCCTKSSSNTNLCSKGKSNEASEHLCSMNNTKVT